jgi:hypothetical protein
MRRLLIALSSASLLLALSAGGTLAGNPAGNGQPSQSCGSGDATLNPPGFDSGGFLKAELLYAGSEDSHSSDNSHAVSQYDVACYHYTQSHQ